MNFKSKSIIKISDIKKNNNIPLPIIYRVGDIMLEQYGTIDLNKIRKSIINSFDYSKTSEGYEFWRSVLIYKNFKLFFSEYNFPIYKPNKGDLIGVLKNYPLCVVEKFLEIQHQNNGFNDINSLQDSIKTLDFSKSYDGVNFWNKVINKDFSEFVAKYSPVLTIDEIVKFCDKSYVFNFIDENKNDNDCLEQILWASVLNKKDKYIHYILTEYVNFRPSVDIIKSAIRENVPKLENFVKNYDHNDRESIHELMVCACMNGRLSLVQQLIYNGASFRLDKNFLFYITKSGNVELLKFALDSNEVDVTYNSHEAVIYAIDKGDIEMCQVFYDFMCDNDIIITDNIITSCIKNDNYNIYNIFYSHDYLTDAQLKLINKTHYIKNKIFNKKDIFNDVDYHNKSKKKGKKTSKTPSYDEMEFEDLFGSSDKKSNVSVKEFNKIYDDKYFDSVVNYEIIQNDHKVKPKDNVVEIVNNIKNGNIIDEYYNSENERIIKALCKYSNDFQRLLFLDEKYFKYVFKYSCLFDIVENINLDIIDTDVFLNIDDDALIELVKLNVPDYLLLLSEHSSERVRVEVAKIKGEHLDNMLYDDSIKVIREIIKHKIPEHIYHFHRNKPDNISDSELNYELITCGDYSFNKNYFDSKDSKELTRVIKHTDLTNDDVDYILKNNSAKLEVVCAIAKYYPSLHKKYISNSTYYLVTDSLLKSNISLNELLNIYNSYYFESLGKLICRRIIKKIRKAKGQQLLFTNEVGKMFIAKHGTYEQQKKLYSSYKLTDDCLVYLIKYGDINVVRDIKGSLEINKLVESRVNKYNLRKNAKNDDKKSDLNWYDNKYYSDKNEFFNLISNSDDIDDNSIYKVILSPMSDEDTRLCLNLLTKNRKFKSDSEIVSSLIRTSFNLNKIKCCDYLVKNSNIDYINLMDIARSGSVELISDVIKERPELVNHSVAKNISNILYNIYNIELTKLFEIFPEYSYSIKKELKIEA